MKKYAGKLKECGELASICIQYGKQPEIDGEWKNIISVSDDVERKNKIDSLLKKMSKNLEQNGFISPKQEVVIRGTGNKFYLDDNEIYYEFFNILRDLYIKNNGKETDGIIIKDAIMQTEKLYFGGFEWDQTKRLDKTTVEICGRALTIPSIRELKGENCSACVERAAIAHNLWLLAGKTSYYVKVTSDECYFGNNSIDAHVFNIVEYDGKYRLFDLAMNNMGLFAGNPIESMENGEPIFVKGGFVDNPGYYANYYKIKSKSVK